MPDVTSSRQERWFLIGIFGAALLVHFWSVTLNWNTPFMPRHEFRQTQTALVSYYIDQQNNFSWLYETPLVGKPWISILMEVPVYEWSVVWLSRATGLSHLLAARTITLACFYLALPALYLLAGRLGLARPRRLLILALILASPVYIFYSRAFLMDSMELMACVWFLFGFVRTMDERRWPWLLLTIVAGTAAALIKSVTFAVWLLPAAGYGLWLVWREVRARQGWRLLLQTIGWGLAAVIVPLAALRWWINLTDPIKAAHASAYLFTSKNLSQGNWGLFNFAADVSPKVWQTLFARWREAIMPPWLIGLFLIAGLVAFKPVRGRVLGLAVIFFLAQLMFPFAYADQDYYFYACTVFLLAALGLILQGALDSRLPRWVCGLLIAVLFGAQLTTYWHGYRVDQVFKSNGGFNYTSALRDLTPKKSVIIVAGADWGAIIPFYAQRKALMIRNGLERDAAYLHRALDELAGEEVSALVLVGPLRANEGLRTLITSRFDLDNVAPAFSQNEADIYLRRSLVAGAQEQVRRSGRYPELTLPSRTTVPKAETAPSEITAEQARSSFGRVAPAPFQSRFERGIAQTDVDGERVIIANPDCDLWLHAPAGATVINWDFGIVPDAYQRDGDRTDGVEFLITGETPDGHHRQIYRRVLDPVKQPGDRGHQRQAIPYQPLTGETLVFSSRPNLSYSYDWSYWIRIEVK